MKQAQSPQRDTTPIRKTARMRRGALAMWKSLVPRPTLAAGTSTMRGSEGRWLAPSATPWDDAGERSLGPAETLVMACHRDLHGCRHAGASPGGEADLPDARVRDACPRRGSREAGGDGRDRNDIRRWRCRSRERPLGVATGAMSGSHRMPAADRAGSPPETPSREGLGGHRRAKREAGDDSPLLARQAARRAGRDTGLRRAVPRRAGRREVPPALGQGPATQGGRDEATRAVGEPGPRRHRPRREGQVALLAPRPGETKRARDAGGVCGPYPEGLPPGTRHGEEPRGARQGARADGGGPRPEADKDTPGQGESTTRGQRAMLPAGAVPELAFRIRQGAVGGVSRPVPRDDEPSRREDGESCLRTRPRNAFPTCVEIPRVLPKEDQLKGNSVLLGTHNQQRRIYKIFIPVDDLAKATK